MYGNVKEAIPEDMPEPLGKSVLLTHYVDANLYHDFTTGRALTGLLHFINGTPLDWFSKHQATVETATYGSEFIATRIGMEHAIDIRTTLRYLGVPLSGPSFMFGDNQSVVTSSTIPHSGLNKRHNALSYHKVRESIAAGILRFHHIKGTTNPADVLSKHCAHPQAWPVIKPIMFSPGEPYFPPEKEEEEGPPKRTKKVDKKSTQVAVTVLTGGEYWKLNHAPNSLKMDRG